MAIAKQPTPTAIRMMSSMGVLPKVARSGAAEGIESEGDRKGEGKMHRHDETDLDDHVVGSRFGVEVDRRMLEAGLAEQSHGVGIEGAQDVGIRAGWKRDAVGIA
jgi:hypothetical protein